MLNPDKLFLKELKALCEKHQLIAVPTFEGKPSAHDHMQIVPLDAEWLTFLTENTTTN